MSRKIIKTALSAAALTLSLVDPVLAQMPSTAHVDALINAMRAKDAATIRTLFAADASQQYGGGPPKTGDAFRVWIESDLIAAEPVIDDAVVTATAEGVIVTGTIRNNRGYTNKANFLFTVEDNKIRHWQIRY